MRAIGCKPAATFSVVLLDVDHFKEYNDRYGHQRGDEALRVIARRAVETLTRPGNTICRDGGEESAIILPATALHGAAVVAVRIWRAVAAAGLAHEASPCSILTVSCGVAEAVRTEADIPAHVLARADAALYAAKGASRGRVEVATLGMADAAVALCPIKHPTLSQLVADRVVLRLGLSRRRPHPTREKRHIVLKPAVDPGTRLWYMMEQEGGRN